MSRGFASNYRIVLLAGAVLLGFAGLGARLVWLQVIARGPFLESVEKARQDIIVESGRRGDILDDRGNVLATSRSLIVLGVDPQMVRPEDAKKWPQLAALIGMPLPELEKILTTRFRPAAPAAAAPADWGSANAADVGGSDRGGMAPPGDGRSPAAAASLVFNFSPGAPAGSADADGTELDDPDADGNRPIRWAKLSDNVAESTDAAIEKLGIRGLTKNRVYRRDYPDNRLAAHVIGFVNHQERPVSGIELYADFYLRGQDGWIESEKDGHREELPQFRTRDVPPAAGYGVKLTIDSDVQQIAEAEIDALVARFQPKKATIIVSDPRTGFILAMANYPTFDLNDYNRLPPAEQGRMRNLAVTDDYEPGSVFKIVAVSGALNDGLVTPASRFDCNLEKVADRNGVVRGLPADDSHYDHLLTVAEILARSSNKGAAQLGLELGPDRFYHYVRAFGFGQLTGFPSGYGESVGELDPPSKWDGETLTRMPMGQSVGVTPLQMHQAMEVIASGGVLLRPQLIREVHDAQGDTVFNFGRNEEHRVISVATARMMARLLMTVATDEGTAPEAAIPGYEVAGKTGTAQKYEPVPNASGRMVLRPSKTHHVSSFVGFFPASRPQVVISVIVDDADAHTPGGIGWGAKVAAPSFKHIGEQLIPYLDIRPPAGVEAAPILALGGVSP